MSRELIKFLTSRHARKRIVILKADGSDEEITGKLTLKMMQNIVGGCIEMVTVLDRILPSGEFVYTRLVVNDEGLLKNLPRNARATELYQRNVRAQFPDSATPFREAENAMRKKFGSAVIVNNPPGYNIDDPHIAGDAIYYAGWTCEEVDTRG